MSDPLAEALHDAIRDAEWVECVHSPENEWQPYCEDAAAALRASPSRLAIAASLLTEEDVARAIARHDHAIGWDRMCTGDDCGSLILRALRGESR